MKMKQYDYHGRHGAGPGPRRAQLINRTTNEQRARPWKYLAYFIAAIIICAIGYEAKSAETAETAQAALESLCGGDYNQTVRDKCYPHWLDLDGDGFDTRQQLLREKSLIQPTIEKRGNRWVVVRGFWYGEYSGHGSSVPGVFHIDHRLSLSEIHRIGGKDLTQSQRTAIANDGANLVIVAGRVNISKSDKSTAFWLPPNVSAWNRYLDSREVVRGRFGLGYDECEPEAIDLSRRIADKTKNGISLVKIHKVFRGGDGLALRFRKRIKRFFGRCRF